MTYDRKLRAKITDLDQVEFLYDFGTVEKLDEYYATRPERPADVWALARYNEPDLIQEPGLCVVVELDDSHDIELEIPLEIALAELSRIGAIVFTEDDRSVSPLGD